ncbi:MAG: ABC transporter substrate-binding protein, partial [Pirellulaceae bacterium]
MFPLRQLPVLLVSCAISISLSGCFGGREVGTVDEKKEVSAELTIRTADIHTLDELSARLTSNGGNMIPLYESVPALLAEYIGSDKTKLTTLNEQLKKEHVSRSQFGTAKSKTTEQTVEEGGDENVKFTLGDLVPMADADFPPLEKLLSENEWLSKPVLNSLDLMRERQAREAKEAKPTSIAQMHKLKNTSLANNLKIRSALGLLAAVDGSDVQYDATWNRHTGADVKSTNPLMISSTAEFDVAGLLGFGLFGFDWTFAPHGSEDSITNWETSKNGLYDKVTLRDDLLWSDGTPITAHDIAFSYKVIMTSKVPVPAVRSGTDQLLGVKAYDDHTVVFFHPDPLATNVWNIMFPVIPKHVYKDSVADDPTLQTSAYHVEKDEKPVTGGAYVLTKRVRGQQIVLERRKSFHTVNGSQVRDIPH